MAVSHGVQHACFFSSETSRIGSANGFVIQMLSHTPGMVYDILPSTTAVFSYAIGSRKLTANEQFFVGVQTRLVLFELF